MLGFYSTSFSLKNIMIHKINKSWQDTVSLYILACKQVITPTLPSPIPAKDGIFDKGRVPVD